MIIMSDQQQYCMYTGKRCTNCNRCQQPQTIIINQQSNKSIIALLIILIIILLIFIMPLITSNITSHFLQNPIKNYDTSPTYVSNYEPSNSYNQGDDYNYNTAPVSSTSNNDNNLISSISDTYNQIVDNTTGENYNPME